MPESHTGGLYFSLRESRAEKDSVEVGDGRKRARSSAIVTGEGSTGGRERESKKRSKRERESCPAAGAFLVR